MMHGQEKSDSSIVAMKPTNKPASAGAEPVEPRGEAKGNAQWLRMHRTQCRERVYQRPELARADLGAAAPEVIAVQLPLTFVSPCD